MAIIAMSVVFLALVLIFFVLKGFGLFMVWFHERRNQKSSEGGAVKGIKKPVSSQVEEEMAAIGLALKMYQEEQHVHEATVLTINRASRVYSPWSSKIHGIPAVPNKK
jgi:Na+-transporting methylmalonyl-CoA/oxaloacetate decarboxylase gamma subunit